MAEIVTLTGWSGREVQFVKDDPKTGAIKDVYFSPDRSYVVAVYRKEPDEEGKRRIDKLVGVYYDRIFNRTGGDYWRKTFCWPNDVVEFDDENETDPRKKHKIGIVMPTYGAEFYFKNGREKECKWWGSAKNYNRFVSFEEKGTLGGFLRAGMELARALRRLHGAGLAHSDLSYKNCLLDPVTGRACLIDVDGLVVPGLFPPDVLGTRDFMAPEIVSTSKLPKNDPLRKLPDRTTDLHALAVLIYLCLLHRHPLRGSKIYSQDDEEQERLEMGDEALFIEHPTDSSNRRVVGRNEESGLPWVDPEAVPYTVCGPYLKELFDKSFIDGLHNPYSRPIADAWEDALAKTLDLLLPCPNPKCPKHEFAYDGLQKAVCPYCGTLYKETVPALDYFSSRNGVDYLPEKRTLIVRDGKELFEQHIDKSVAYNEKLTAKQRERVGFFSKEGNDWVLHNERIKNLFDMTNQRPVPCGSEVKLTESLRLSLYDERRSYIVQVRLANRVDGPTGDALVGLNVEFAESDAKMKSKRIDGALKAVQALRLPNGSVGQKYYHVLNFKDLRDNREKNIAISILKSYGFDKFGLTCSVVKDSIVFSGVPTQEYDGKIAFFIDGKFKSYYLFGGKTQIPGEFKFTNVRISKVFTITQPKTTADAEERLGCSTYFSKGDAADASESGVSSVASDPNASVSAANASAASASNASASHANSSVSGALPSEDSNVRQELAKSSDEDSAAESDSSFVGPEKNDSDKMDETWLGTE